MVNIGAERPSARVFGTFGIYRYILACMVVVTHTAPDTWHFAGEYAVFAFFILSGYVVSYILHYTYLPSRHGLWKYAVNRFLRIYPPYWIVFAGSLWLVIHYPNQIREMHPAYGYPDHWWMWLINILLIGMTDPLQGIMLKPLVLPVGWSLGVEILFWAMIPKFLTSKSGRWLLALGAVSYTLLVVMLLPSQSLFPRYYSALAVSLPFCIGLMLFIMKLQGRFIVPHKAGIIAILAFFILLFFAPDLFTEPRFTGFYAALVINTFVISYLSRVASETLPAAIRALDNFIGNLAYPIYLVHMPLGVLLYASFPSLPLHSSALCFVDIILSSVVAFVLYHCVEVPVNRLKKTIKSLG